MAKQTSHKDENGLTNFLPQAEAGRILGITRAGISWLVTNKRLRTKEMWGKKFLYRDEVLAYKAEKEKKVTKTASTKKVVSKKKAASKKKGSKK